MTEEKKSTLGNERDKCRLYHLDQEKRSTAHVQDKLPPHTPLPSDIDVTCQSKRAWRNRLVLPLGIFYRLRVFITCSTECQTESFCTKHFTNFFLMNNFPKVFSRLRSFFPKCVFGSLFIKDPVAPQK